MGVCSPETFRNLITQEAMWWFLRLFFGVYAHLANKNLVTQFWKLSNKYRLYPCQAGYKTRINVYIHCIAVTVHAQYVQSSGG